ncbi:MAG TPA: molybdenum cofactor biosynthesis protein MoaE [Deltaproteobacteria bacterium]|nr:molybdenum cofactor biosynthesis protein MoaE [Deltaproteobacteria bacterium]
MIEQWIREIKEQSKPEELGMILVHNGIVRATSKNHKTVLGMETTFDHSQLEKTISVLKEKEGIVDIRAWINEGVLKIGDDIMKVCVAGRFRTDILPVFQELLAIIKNEIIQEKEF